MSRKGSARSLSQGRAEGDDCEHCDENERHVEAPQGHVEAPRASETNNVKSVQHCPPNRPQSGQPCVVFEEVERSADALPAPEEVKYILPAESSRPNPKTSLPMPQPPARKKNPQTAFDFNCKTSKEVIAHQLNMEDRDQNHLNQDLKAQFLDIFGEPDPQYHSVACVWTNSYRALTSVLHFGVRLRQLTQPCSVARARPRFAAVAEGRPTFALVRIALAQLLTIWPMFLIYIIRPFFYSVGAVFSTFRLHRSNGPAIQEVWEKGNM
ncbi:Caveolin [Ancylostoma duodenale]|uniref:Caveolin n=1 Tax=Ancylostoma duodenale TaxID=51022 RepID=A0A0C2DT22_9BILA|nr:Caveolin [Ancylostoma duodenale]